MNLDPERRRLHTAANIVQAMTDELNALLRRYPSTTRELFLAAEQLHIRAVLPLLSNEDRITFEIVTSTFSTKVEPYVPKIQEADEDAGRGDDCKKMNFDSAILFYSDRLEIERAFNEWAEINGVLKVPNALVAFLEIRGLLNTPKAVSWCRERKKGGDG